MRDPVLCGETFWSFKERRFTNRRLTWSAIENRRSLKSNDDRRCTSISGHELCRAG
jgi:hypothetical protein